MCWCYTSPRSEQTLFEINQSRSYFISNGIILVKRPSSLLDFVVVNPGSNLSFDKRGKIKSAIVVTCKYQGDFITLTHIRLIDRNSGLDMKHVLDQVKKKVQSGQIFKYEIYSKDTRFEHIYESQQEVKGV